MDENPDRKQSKLRLLAPVMLAAALLLCLVLWGKGPEEPEAESPTVSALPLPSAAPSPTPSPTVQDADADKIRISELMLRNRATLPDEDGDFPDWIELENRSDTAVELTGWRLTDKEKNPGWTFPETVLAPGERLLLFASGKDLPGHLSFSLSEGETLSLFTARGTLADQVLCPEGEADRAWLPDGEGGLEESLYPTPGLPNTRESYTALMEARETESPLVINEVVVFNRDIRRLGILGESDWVELKNVSEEAIELSDYYLSDDKDQRLLFRLPEQTLYPGGFFLLRFHSYPYSQGTAALCTAFTLDSSAERLYLSREDGSLADYVSLRGIPRGGSFGRMPGENGWFFFADTSPGSDNADGKRWISAAPTVTEPDGAFDDVDSVTVTLQGEGEIHYTTDGSYPTGESPLYEEPITLEQTTILRAVAVEEGALPSPALTLNYYLNEYHSLPIVSLVADDKRLIGIYDGAIKDIEVPCSLCFYEQDGGFKISCGVKMHGETSLALPKKNMSLRFRGAYGQAELDYDVFGYGEGTVFRNLLLRAGQDQTHAIIRNELSTELAYAATDRVVVSRNRYCVLYLDGRYNGIYALGEKLNEATYAQRAGVSRDSVEVMTAPLSKNTDFYTQVFAYADSHDLAAAGNYEEICSRLDVDSLIDWVILEGCVGNQDLSSGNVRYCRSLENDGKWRLMFYDLDGAFYHTETCFSNILSPWSRTVSQTAKLVGHLMRNPEFRTKLVQRGSELIPTAFSNERILEELNRLSAEIDPEVARDFEKLGGEKPNWDWNIDWLRDEIELGDWNKACVTNFCYLTNLSARERAKYFPD